MAAPAASSWSPAEGPARCRPPLGAALFSAWLVLALATAAVAEGEARKEVRVHLDEQTLKAMEGDDPVYTFDIVTGKDGKETTAGR